jgi:hypothetical protein
MLAHLKDADYRMDYLKEYLESALWDQFSKEGRGLAVKWMEQNGQFLHPNASLQLEIDPDLTAIGMAFDNSEFFDRTIADLRAGGEPAIRARRLLERYVPPGPKDGGAEQWAAWWAENKEYAFASDSGDYCWYIDPLAKARKISTSKLRGILRADEGSNFASR